MGAMKLRILQGDPIIHDVHDARMAGRYRGLPTIGNGPCTEGCDACASVCPAKAVKSNPVSIDLGRCSFCPLCEEACPQKKISFSKNYHLAASSRDALIVSADSAPVRPEKASSKIRSYFGKSLKLRQVSAGGCNGCELELNALGNVNFDIGRYGIDFVASPRHADGVVITGPVTENMSQALDVCFEAVPNPKVVILVGACAISGGVFDGSPHLQRSFLEEHGIDLYVPGCPPHPLTFVCGVLDWLDKKG